MRKLPAILLGLGVVYTAGAAPIITPVGDGMGYDLFGDDSSGSPESNEVNSYRSTGVPKTFDGDGDDVYGTEGVIMVGNGTLINSSGSSFNTAQTQVGATWATATAGADANNNVRADSSQGPMDDPTAAISAAVADWANVGFHNRADTGDAGAWGELIEIAFDSNSPQKFRIGLIAGTQGSADGRWDPSGFRITDGGATVYATVTDLEANTGYAPMMVFFDVDLNGETSGVLGIENSQRNASQGGSITGITFDEIEAPDNSALTFSPAALALELYAPDSTVDGIITATYVAGAVTSNDIDIISLTADSGFSAAAVPDLGTANLTEDITVTYDNSGIGLVNGESTNSTLEVVWSEAGVGVINTSSIPLSVTYINEPNSFDLSPSSLSMTLTAPATSINGTIAASYIEGTIAADIEIISVVVTNGFSVSPDSFTLSEFNTNQEIVVTYTNTGALENHADTAASSVVVTWTETGSGVTNTAGGSVDVFYYNPTINDALIAGYDFDDGTGTATTNVTDYNEYVVASGYGVGTGLVSVISANGNGLGEDLDAEYNLFGTANQISFGSASSSLLYTLMNDEDNLALAITNADYMVFTVAPTNDYLMDLTSFTFRSRVNQLASSAERWALFSSVDGFATTNDAIATGQTTVTHTYVNNVVDLSDARFQELEGEVEFRLYMYGGSTGYSSATLFDKVVLNGSVYPLAPPPVSASVSGGEIIISWDDDRTYNVLTNGNLMFGDWGVAETGVSSPVSISIGSEDQMFYTLGK